MDTLKDSSLVHSRRKQSKPEKLTITKQNSSYGTDFEQGMSGLLGLTKCDSEKCTGSVQKNAKAQIQDDVVNHIIGDLSSLITKGTTYGPFPVSPCSDISSAEDRNEIFKPKDLFGNVHYFRVRDELSYQWLNQLAFPSLGDDNHTVNCKLFHENSKALRVVTTKDVPSINDLVAVFVPSPTPTDTGTIQKQKEAKNFKCDRCDTRFSAESTLKAHKTYYCPEKDESNCNTSKDKESRLKCFICDRCGIRFSSMRTLEGHKNFYCKGPQPQPSALSSKSPASEQMSSTSSGSQVSHPAAHSLVHGYLCLVCGYKGYSMRGMKSHMKTHEECTDGKLNTEELCSPDFVRPITSASSATNSVQQPTKTVPSASATEIGTPAAAERVKKSLPAPTMLCPRCQETFPDMESYSKHTCKDSEKEAESVAESTAGHYKCNYCSYGSPYKGNVKRHVTLGIIHKLRDTCSQVSGHMRDLKSVD